MRNKVELVAKTDKRCNNAQLKSYCIASTQGGFSSLGTLGILVPALPLVKIIPGQGKIWQELALFERPWRKTGIEIVWKFGGF